MAKTKRKHAGKTLRGVVEFSDSIKREQKRKPTIVEIAKHFGFTSLGEFCQWLARAVAMMDSPTKNDSNGNEVANELHNSEEHVFAKTLLASLKAKYGASNPEYFATKANTGNTDAIRKIASQYNFDAKDPEAVKANLVDGFDLDADDWDSEESEESEVPAKTDK